MKLLFFILCIMFFSSTMLQAQEEQIEKKEKNKKEKVEKAPQKIPFRAMTKEEYDKMRAKEKSQPPPPDIALFQSRTTPISQDVLTKNRNFYQSVKGDVAIDKSLILENLGLNSMSRVEIADNADAMVILHSQDVYIAKLSYYTTSGQLLWEKNIEFKTPGGDLSRKLLYHQISANGKRVVVYAVQDESASIVEVYDEMGSKMKSLQPSGELLMAPSGNYFYYNGQLAIYNANFSPVNLTPESFFAHNKTKYEYRYGVKIFDNDIMVLLIYELETIRDSETTKSGRVIPGRIRKRKLNNQVIYIYDLNQKIIIFQKSLMLDENEGYNTYYMDSKNCRFVGGFYDPLQRTVDLHIIDLKTGLLEKRTVGRIGNPVISEDGSSLLIERSYRTGQYSAIRKYSLLDLTQNQFIVEDKHYDPKRTILSFNLTGNTLQLLFHQVAALNPLSIYSIEGQLLKEFYGWFNLKQHYGLLPIAHQNNSEKIDLLKLNLEEVK